MVSFKEGLVKNLETLSGDIIDHQRQEGLIASVKGDKTGWMVWKAKISGILENLNYADFLKFKALALFVEQSPGEQSTGRLVSFLVERVEFYKNYDFKKAEESAEAREKRSAFFLEKFLRLFISRSFLGILVLGIITTYILWYYLDRQGAVEFTDKIVKVFLRGVN